MSKAAKNFALTGEIERLSLMDSSVHRIGALAKLLTTVTFIVAVASFDIHSFRQMIPFLVFPVFMISRGGLPYGLIIKGILAASPFAFMVAVFHPFMDPVNGWLAFASIMLKFALTVSSVFVLIASTGFIRLCGALQRLYLPDVFVTQLMFLYRYIFVFMDEASRMSNAKSLRSFGKGDGIVFYANMLGQLLLRTYDRAQRIHRSMLSRCFDGELSVNVEQSTVLDVMFTTVWAVVFLCFRLVDVPLFLGSIFTGGF